jgi:hypothetical protein
MPSVSLLKNDPLRRFSCPLAGPSSLRRTVKYASLLRISGALHLALFEQPAKDDFFSTLQNHYTLKFESRSTKKSKKLQYLRR